MKARRCVGVVASLALLLSLAGAAAPHRVEADGPAASPGTGLSATLLANAVPAVYYSSWQRTVVEETVNEDLASNVSVAIDTTTGTVFVSYYDKKNGDLKLATLVKSGGNCGGGAWNCQTVDSDGDVGMYSSIYVDPSWGGIPGTIRIAYYDATNRALKYTACVSFGGPCTWTPPAMIDKGSDAGFFSTFAGLYPSLSVDGAGVSHIGYVRDSFFGSTLKYATYVGAGGSGCSETSAWDCSTVTTSSVGTAIGGLSLDSNMFGGPAMAYYSYTNSSGTYTGSVSYAKWVGIMMGNCGPSNTWQCDVIDGGSGADIGHAPVLPKAAGILPSGRIAYYDYTNASLKFAWQFGMGTGNCGPSNSWYCLSIERVSPNPIGHDSAMGLAMVGYSDGNFMIAYEDDDDLPGNGQLKIARIAPTTGNCGMGAFECLTVDDGLRWRSRTNTMDTMGGSIGVALNSGSVATIAYGGVGEDPADPTTTVYSLNVAQQWLLNALPLIERNFSN